MSMQVRPAAEQDGPAILAIAASALKFGDDEVALLQARFVADLQSEFAASLWQISTEGEAVTGVAYAIEEPMTDATWNLLMISVEPARQGKGIGSALIQNVQTTLRSCKARLLIVDTGGVAQFEPARAFYRQHGFVEVARTPDFYADGLDRVTCHKRLR